MECTQCRCRSCCEARTQTQKTEKAMSRVAESISDTIVALSRVLRDLSARVESLEESRKPVVFDPGVPKSAPVDRVGEVARAHAGAWTDARNEKDGDVPPTTEDP